MWVRRAGVKHRMPIRFFLPFESGLAVGTEVPADGTCLSYTLLTAGPQELVAEAEGHQRFERCFEVLRGGVVDLEVAIKISG